MHLHEFDVMGCTSKRVSRNIQGHPGVSVACYSKGAHLVMIKLVVL